MPETDSLNNDAHPAMTVIALFEKILRMSADFLLTVQTRVPKNEEIISFSQAREETFSLLQLLLKKETTFVSHEPKDEKNNPALQARLLVSYRKELKEIDRQLSKQISERHKEIDTRLKDLNKGKKNLLNYRSHRKTAPRFCRRYA